MSANSFRVCVVGAGSAGIAAVKVLAERGIDVDCCELSDRVGGNWVWGNRNGVSAAYRSLHINTSRQRMEFNDFPMPRNLPDFARHDQIADYFAAYTKHFGFGDRIRFGTGVTHVEPKPDGSFAVTLSTGDTERYDAVLVANGHHWDPRMPEPMFPGVEGFRGEIMHSHSYTEEAQLAGRRVVVVGMGNSAMDIAVDASYHAAETYLSARRGVHVIPKYVWGKPYDQIAGKEWLPSALRWPVARRLMAAATGPMTRYGLPEPDHKFAQAHPTMSSRILDRLAHGAITPVEERTGSRVRTFPVRGRSKSAFLVSGTEVLFLPENFPSLDKITVYNGWFPALSRVMPAVSALAAIAGPVVQAASGLMKGPPGGPDAAERAKTGAEVVAVADSRVEVRLEGPNAYTLTGELLAWAAIRLSVEGPVKPGVVGPVDAFGLEPLRDGCAELGLVRQES
ncbi:NAD(P)-binding domain-containing protein [Amycolatopsis circi]|uniref:NAD(P)-binding domain-containing protein n=1 Tax=Amycolatopsis circi TaxID=871959 RepID=UPI001FC9FC22|nr:NAD(P)-binding domain-containing protein [Amycolatopsis circi]